MEKKLLTPLELKVMNLLWANKPALVKELMALWPDKPVPAYNTISTIIRILEEKGYVDHTSEGRSHRYFPIVAKPRYQKRFMRNVLENVFAGSLSGMVSSLLDEKQLSPEEIEALKTLIEKGEET